MNESLYIAATGMHMQQRNVETIANNLANVNTPGFKKGRVSFQDLVYRELAQVSNKENVEGSSGFWLGSGVGISALTKYFAPGELKKTEVPLDLAIQGEGFFEVTTSDGIDLFTRGGSLQVDKDGYLSTLEGHILKPGIHVGVDAKEIRISTDGRILVRQVGRDDFFEVANIELANFSDTSGLVPRGNNLYQSSERSGQAIYGKPGIDGMGSLAQGFVESSNVKLVEEMVDLMIAQRAYESSVKVIQASDEMLGMSNNLRK